VYYALGRQLRGHSAQACVTGCRYKILNTGGSEGGLDTVGYANIASLRHALSGQQQLLRQHMLQTHAHEDYAGEQEEELRESVDFGASLLISKSV
jgi:hypothetical protein